MFELWDRLPPTVRGTLRTLITIGLNGGAAALGAVVIDPDHFSLAHLKHVGIVFGVGALAAVVNWLRQSPWKTPDVIPAIARSVPVLLLAGVLAASSACGPKQYHSAVVANTSIAQAIFALQDAEIAAHQAKLVTDAQHATYKAEILHLLEAGDDLTLALKAWDPSQPVPANVGLAIGNVQRLLTDLQLNSPQASALLYTVQTVLSVLRGSGVLPAANDDTETRERWVVVELGNLRDRSLDELREDVPEVDGSGLPQRGHDGRLDPGSVECEFDVGDFERLAVDPDARRPVEQSTHALIVLPEVA